MSSHLPEDSDTARAERTLHMYPPSHPASIHASQSTERTQRRRALPPSCGRWHADRMDLTQKLQIKPGGLALERRWMCPSVCQRGGLAGLSSRNGYPAFCATRQDAGLATSCTSMICRKLVPANVSKTHAVTALTAAGAMPRPRAATAVQ